MKNNERKLSLCIAVLPLIYIAVFAVFAIITSITERYLFDTVIPVVFFGIVIFHLLIFPFFVVGVSIAIIIIRLILLKNGVPFRKSLPWIVLAVIYSVVTIVLYVNWWNGWMGV